MKNLIGIMQGRLSPKYKGNYQAHPVNNWKQEFKLASSLQFECIEFILDFDKVMYNPLLNKDGNNLIVKYSLDNNIKIKSVCADIFMKRPLFSQDEEIKRSNFYILVTLMNNSAKIGVTDIVIPFVDNSSLFNDHKKQTMTIKFLKKIFDFTKNININLCLETDLPPDEFIKFLRKINNPKLKVNYDTGNSASLGYCFKEELDAYGHLITNIHIKDRIFEGGSVPLGLGSCNFDEFFKHLSTKSFNGVLIMQAFRDEDAIKSLIPQYEFIKPILNKYLSD